MDREYTDSSAQIVRQKTKTSLSKCLMPASLSSDNLCSDSLYADTDTVVVKDGVE